MCGLGLWINDYTVLRNVYAAEGVQQGDSLGPLLFCLTIHPLLQDIKAEFVSGYLDDIGLGGPVNVVTADIRQLENKVCQFGLHLNHHKCEVIVLTNNLTNSTSWDRDKLAFQKVSIEDATLLGAPITTGKGVDKALAVKRMDLEQMVHRLALLPARFVSLELIPYDETLKRSLSSLLNIDMTPLAWSQACLPIRWRGVGVRSAYQLAPSAFLASTAGVADLLTLILPPQTLAIPDAEIPKAIRAWTSIGGESRHRS